MEFIFIDDSNQNKPSRDKMKGPLLAIGGVHMPTEKVGPLEQAIRDHCASVGFPEDEQFKWSPSKTDKFMREKLQGQDRIDFFCKLLSLAKDHGARATVVISDCSKGKASSKSKTYETDVTAMYLERCDWICAADIGVPIVARGSGGVTDEKKFVANCLNLINNGTEYSDLKKFPLGIIMAPSKQMRLLQMADVVTSCTVARVAGESPFSKPVFEAILPLFCRDSSRIGGIGLKIHPDYNYGNLYHWLLHDSHIWKGMQGHPLPSKDLLSYFENAGEAHNQQSVS